MNNNGIYDVIAFNLENKYVEDFLSLPPKLYGRNEITQNKEEERKIIEGTHILSKYFILGKFIAYSRRGGEVCGRCAVTVYPDAETAYIGYFESVDDAECAAELFKAAEGFTRANGLNRITGPMDCSFWLKYRLKVNGFEKPPYTGEPYNKQYYKKMFEDNGFKVNGRWVSNIYEKMPLFSKRRFIYRERLRFTKNKRYKIVSTSLKDFDKTMETVYLLISETFKSFPFFREITIEDFREIFKNYRYILDFHFVKIAYCGGAPAAFSITLPDYRNLLFQDLTVLRKFQIMLKKIRSSNYVSLYLGARQGHYGLGKAFTQTIIDDLYVRRARCIGALIAKGAFTENYVNAQIKNRNEYVMFEKQI